jgi:hypothetical protein
LSCPATSSHVCGRYCSVSCMAFPFLFAACFCLVWPSFPRSRTLFGPCFCLVFALFFCLLRAKTKLSKLENCQALLRIEPSRPPPLGREPRGLMPSLANGVYRARKPRLLTKAELFATWRMNQGRQKSEPDPHPSGKQRKGARSAFDAGKSWENLGNVRGATEFA